MVGPIGLTTAGGSTGTVAITGGGLIPTVVVGIGAVPIGFVGGGI